MCLLRHERGWREVKDEACASHQHLSIDIWSKSTNKCTSDHTSMSEYPNEWQVRMEFSQAREWKGMKNRWGTITLDNYATPV